MSKFFLFIGKLWIVFSIIFSIITVPLWAVWLINPKEEIKPTCPKVQKGVLHYPGALDDMSILSESGHSKHIPNF